MIWLLRLLPYFRTLEGDLASLQTQYAEMEVDKLRLQDRLEAALNDKENLWSLFQEALGNERTALRTMVNHATQRTGGGIPFPEAHALPPETARPLQKPGPVGRQGRMLASQVAAYATEDFLKREYAGRIQEVHSAEETT